MYLLKKDMKGQNGKYLSAGGGEKAWKKLALFTLSAQTFQPAENCEKMRFSCLNCLGCGICLLSLES